VAFAFVSIADTFSQRLEDEAVQLKAEMGSSMVLINDPANVPYDRTTTNLSFYLKNSGSSELSLEDIVVSANGTAVPSSDLWAEHLEGGSRWLPGDVVQVRFHVPSLRTGVDYPGWASTSGLTDGGSPRGSAQDSFAFRIGGS